MSPEPRLVEVRKNVLKQNDLVARALRTRFRAAGVFVVSLVSSPGSGKTAFLEKTLTLLRSRYRVAALVGDLATENDAVRLARSQAPVKQIITGTVSRFEGRAGAGKAHGQTAQLLRSNARSGHDRRPDTTLKSRNCATRCIAAWCWSEPRRRGNWIGRRARDSA